MRTLMTPVFIAGTAALVSCQSAPPLGSEGPTSYSAEDLEQRLTDARWNMISLAGAFNTYNLNHEAPPQADTWQQALIDEGLGTADEMVSPASDGDNVEYVLVPASEISFHREIVLVYEDPDHHAEEVVVLFHDLHVESVPRQLFEELASAQGFEIVE